MHKSESQLYQLLEPQFKEFKNINSKLYQGMVEFQKKEGNCGGYLHLTAKSEKSAASRLKAIRARHASMHAEKQKIRGTRLFKRGFMSYDLSLRRGFVTEMYELRSAGWIEQDRRRRWMLTLEGATLMAKTHT